jgi:hypothetical protein
LNNGRKEREEREDGKKEEEIEWLSEREDLKLGFPLY